MNDYITVLLEDLESRAADFLPGGYYAAIARETAASEALTAALNDDQRDLLLTWEDARNAADDLYQSALLRQAFLLGREVVR